MAYCEKCDKIGWEWCHCDKSQKLLNQTQAAMVRCVNRRTIWMWIKAGLPTVEIAGRKLIRQVDLENYQPQPRGPKGKGQ